MSNNDLLHPCIYMKVYFARKIVFSVSKYPIISQVLGKINKQTNKQTNKETKTAEYTSVYSFESIFKYVLFEREKKYYYH